VNSLVYNTRSEEVTRDQLISPQCAVENFSEICIYSIVSEGRNVILKYQGGGLIELRKLTTTKLSKKGPLSMFTSMLSSSSASGPPNSSPTPSPRNTSVGAAAATGAGGSSGSGSSDGKECILDFNTNATEISRDLASHNF
jgi:hypothetical protein